MPSKPVWLIVDAHGRAFVSAKATRNMAIAEHVNTLAWDVADAKG